MKSIVRSLTGLGGAAALAASLLATGCGNHGLTATATMAKATTVKARATASNSLFHGRQALKPLADPASAQKLLQVGRELQASHINLPDTDTMQAEDDAAAAAAPKQDDVGALYDLLSSYGYGGDRRHMVQAIHAAVYQYVMENTDPTSVYYAPRGWDADEYARIGAHFCYWLPNFSVPVNNADDYASQALMIAQSRFSVQYYVWVSKPAAGFWDRQQAWQAQAGACPAGPAPAPGDAPADPFASVTGYAPIFDASTGFNIVKAVGNNGWMANIGTRKVTSPTGKRETVGVIQDYFEMPAQFLSPVDLGNLVPIPPELYF